MNSSVRRMYRDLSMRLIASAKSRPMTFVRITEANARNRVFPTAPSIRGSWKMRSKLSSPMNDQSPRPVQSVKAKNPPVNVAT